MATKKPVQLTLPEPKTHGGRRPNAGRPPGPNANTPHRIRPFHDKADPVHVTLKVQPDLPSLRRHDLCDIIFATISRPITTEAAAGERFGIVHFTVQSDHVHLIVEARDRAALSSGMRSLNIRLARALNAALHRRGSVFVARYHARAVRYPREVRHLLVYVLLNWVKHHERRGVDPCSSGRWFDGWVRPSWSGVVGLSPVRAPRTWLLARGWRENGPLLDPFREAPRGGG